MGILHTHSMRTGSGLTNPTGVRHVNRRFCMGKPPPWPPGRCMNRASTGRRGRGGPPRPRRTPQIATDPPHTPYRPVRPGERVGGGDEGSHGPCVARADLTGQPAAEGALAGRGRPSSPRRGRQCAPRGGRTRTPHGVRSRTAVAPDTTRVPGPSARPRRAKKKSSPPPPPRRADPPPRRPLRGTLGRPAAGPPASPRAPGEDDFLSARRV